MRVVTIMFQVSYLLAASKLLFTKSLKGLMCSSFVNKTWFAMLCRICKKRQEYTTRNIKNNPTASLSRSSPPKELTYFELLSQLKNLLLLQLNYVLAFSSIPSL